VSAVRIRDFPLDLNRNEEVLSVDHSRPGLVIGVGGSRLIGAKTPVQSATTLGCNHGHGLG